MSSVSFGQRGGFICHVVSQGVFPNSSEPFIVYSDASKMSLSDVIVLKDLVLKTCEGELSYRELELVVVVLCLNFETLVDESRFEIGIMITHEKRIGVKIRINELMRFYDKIHVLDTIEPRMLILQRGLSSGLSVRLRAAMTYQNLREIFGWLVLKEKETRVYLEVSEELPRALKTKAKIDYKL
ncbi:hypothetical protein CR513_07686, partial [Mucuna pruriens]